VIPQGIGGGMEHGGLSDSGGAVEPQRIVHLAGHVGDGSQGAAGKAVAGALVQGVKNGHFGHGDPSFLGYLIGKNMIPPSIPGGKPEKATKKAPRF
jgi:hypothetical protein